MTFEQFSQGTSPLHNLDTRVKLVSATVLTLVIALCQNYQTALTGLVLAIVVTHFAQLDFSKVLKRLLFVNSFTIFLWLTLPITYPGEPVFSLGPATISKAGVILTGLITLKTNAIIIFCIGLLATSPIADLGHGMRKLHFPKKLCLLLLFSYRYIFVIHQEFIRLSRAAKLRNFSPKTNMHTYQTYGYLFGMTLLQSYHRAERVSQAMLLRGFTGQFYSLNDFRLRRIDYIFLVTALISACALCSFELYLNYYP